MSILVKSRSHSFPIDTLRTRIKICGVKSVDIAQHAVSAGADALGLNFYEKSKRLIDKQQGVEIQRAIDPFVSLVGVFVNPQRDYVEDILKLVKLDYLQFHGDEDREFCTSFGLNYIKGVRVSEHCNLLEIEDQYADAHALLLDSYNKSQYGGTGEVFDWNHANYGGNQAILLAGGINASNVASAIQSVRPYAVDVSSGVETRGHKDPVKITEFCRAVHNLY